MRLLCKAARDLGMHVPLFTNDAWEVGSYISRPDNCLVGGKKTFGIDLVMLNINNSTDSTNMSCFAPLAIPLLLQLMEIRIYRPGLNGSLKDL